MSVPAGGDEEFRGRADPSLLALFRVVFEKELTLLKRYWFNTAGGLIANYLMFVFIFFGGQVAAPAVIDDNLTGIIVGWFVWTMSWGSFQESAQTLTREASWGTLEQTYMNPHGLFPVVVARILVGLTFNVGTGVVMLFLMMVTTGHWIVFDPLTILPLAFVTMASATGLGFVFGGLALVYKRISSVFLVVQFMLLGAIGTSSVPETNVLPLSWGTALLTHAMEEGTMLWQLPAVDLVGVVAVSASYLALGYVAFTRFVGVAKRRGTMGHY